MSFFNACAIVLKSGDKFVLVREVRDVKTGLYNLPAGTLEIHEDVLSCIRREAREETGVNVRIEHFMGVYEIVIAKSTNVLLLVFAGSIDPSVPLGSDEHREVVAFSYDEVLSLHNTGQLRSPAVLRAITDAREGNQLPLSAVRVWRVERLDAITVGPTVVSAS